jgi:ribA/ribD-fused uncharacterized protein
MSKTIYENDEIVLFWHGIFSNWHLVDFVDDDGVKYNCTEQYMMAKKALRYGDNETYNKIMNAHSPKEQKALGRLVKKFDADDWDSCCMKIVYDGNLLKYSQNEELRKVLLATGNKTIAEASPVDKIWGIGLAPDNPKAFDKKNWKGTNYLGLVLMNVRSFLLTKPKTK